MPGKSDFGSVGKGTAGQGKYFPGTSEWRAWDSGVQARFAGALIGDNPFPVGLPTERTAWEDGWSEAEDGNVANRRMPYIFGTPPP